MHDHVRPMQMGQRAGACPVEVGDARAAQQSIAAMLSRVVL